MSKAQLTELRLVTSNPRNPNFKLLISIERFYVLTPPPTPTIVAIIGVTFANEP